MENKGTQRREEDVTAFAKKKEIVQTIFNLGGAYADPREVYEAIKEAVKSEDVALTFSEESELSEDSDSEWTRD